MLKLKKFFSYLVIFTYLSSAVELGQMGKIPMLFIHFYEHQQKDADLSISEFLSIHYLNEQHKDGDYADDMKLPFKSLDHSYTSISIQDVPKSYFVDWNFTMKEFKEVKQNFFYSITFYPLSVHSIWQPPELG